MFLSQKFHTKQKNKLKEKATQSDLFIDVRLSTSPLPFRGNTERETGISGLV